MGKNIDVFNGGGTGTLGGTYLINVKYERDKNRLILLSQKKIDGVYVAFMRYKTKFRNGTKDSGRPRLSKWFAFQYRNEREGAIRYKDTSMFYLDDETKNDGGWQYTIGSRLNGMHITYTSNAKDAIIRNFFSLKSDGWESTIQKPQDSLITFEIGTHIRGYNNCGIGLVNEDGYVMSNIVKMKIVARSMYKNTDEDEWIVLDDMESFANYGILLYPNK